MTNPTSIQQPRGFDPDLKLVQRMATGDTRALDEIYTRHGPSVLSFLTARLNNRQVAEEVLQDVMLAAWRNAANFRGDSSVRTWLLVIARNRAINMYRKHQPALISFDEAFDAPVNDTEPLERFERKVKSSSVRQAITHLSEPYREVLELVFYHQLSGAEAAEVLGVQVGTVKSRLHRAKEELRRTLLSEGSL